MSPILEGLRRDAPVERAADAQPALVRPRQAELESGEPAHFRRLLHGISGAVDRGEAIMDRAATGAYQSMDAATLIALQAGIYRYGEAVDLTSKLVDRVASGVRTIVQAGH